MFYKSFDQFLDAAKINNSVVFLSDNDCHTVFHHKKKKKKIFFYLKFLLI
jgi:hypothetical protein